MNLSCLVFLLPIFWVISSSLKPAYQVLEVPPRWIPEKIVRSNYPDVLSYIPFARYGLNTLLIAAGARKLPYCESQADHEALLPYNLTAEMIKP